MNDLLAAFKPDFQKAIDHLKTELSSIRTGRASAAVIENITVNAYGGAMQVKGVASIGVPEPEAAT